MSYYVITLWYFGVDYSNDLHYFSNFFFLLDAISGKDSALGRSRCIQLTLMLIQSVSLGDQSNVRCDLKGGV